MSSPRFPCPGQPQTHHPLQFTKRTKVLIFLTQVIKLDWSPLNTLQETLP